MSVRRLQEGFRQWVGCSPMEYLVRVRLGRADADLAADPDATLSDVAARWGFFQREPVRGRLPPPLRAPAVTTRTTRPSDRAAMTSQSPILTSTTTPPEEVP
jgi:transcriptional regulator GlxA family with amidase domain